MVHATTALTLFTTALLTSGSSLVTAHHPRQHAAPHQRAAAAVAEAAKGLIPDFDKIRQVGSDMVNRSAGESSSSHKKPRVKKRATKSCSPQKVFKPSGTASPTSPASSSSAAPSSTDGWSSETPTPSSTWSSAAPEPTETGKTNWNSPWQLTETWQGSSFFDHWQFWHWDDPTNGIVDYVEVDQAVSTARVSSIISYVADGQH